MIRNGDAISPGTTAASTKHGTCVDCGALFIRRATAKRCKPCGSGRHEREQARRTKERRALKRAAGACNGN